MKIALSCFHDFKFFQIKKLIFILFFIHGILFVNAQLITELRGIRTVFERNQNDEFVMFDRGYIGEYSDALDFYHLSNEFQLLRGISISRDKHQFFLPHSTTFNKGIFTFTSGMIKNFDPDSISQVMVLYDFITESSFGYSFNESRGPSVEVESFQNRQLLIQSLNDNSHDFFLMEENCSLKNFKIIADEHQLITVTDIHFLDQNNIIVLMAGFCSDEPCSAIFKMNLVDNSWNAKIHNDCTLLEINSSYNSILTCTGYTDKFKNETNNDRDGLVMEINEELLPEKSILIYADNFKYNEIKLVPLDNQEYLLGYATKARYPVIFSKLNQNFELLFQQGFDFLNPDIILGNDDNLYIFSYEENDQNILTKTNLDLNLNECPNYAACLNTKEIAFTTQELQLAISDIDSLERFELDWEFTTTGFSPYECQDNSLPSALFLIPDTICVGDCTTTQDTDNKHAQNREWSIQTPTKNFTIEDSLQLEICFNNPGTYKIKQTIWVLGCEYEFEKEIEVIDRIKVQLEDEVVCAEETFIELIEDMDHPHGATWSDGTLGLQKEILESGYYEVTISNGYCDTIVGANITLVNGEINLEEILILPEDASICQEDIPFTFSIPFFENEGIFMNGEELETEKISITETGQYNFTTIINGCSFEKIFNLEIDSCFSQIYFPTAFSPNADGINDTFQPLGKNFVPQQLRIYNRWGAQISTSISIWDGTLGGKQLNPDVFFYVFIYENTLTGMFEEKAGCLNLMR